MSIYREPEQTDAYPDIEPVFHKIAGGVRATFGQSIRSSGLPNDPTVGMLRVHFFCDPTDVKRNDIVKDESVGTEWTVLNVDARPGFAGIDYIRGIVMHRELAVEAGEPVTSET